MVLDVTVTEGVPVTDLSTPPGFSPVSIWAYDEFFGLPPGVMTETLQFQVDVPVQTTDSQWKAVLDTVRGTLHPQGWDIIAYAVWEAPTQLIQVPDQICVTGTSACLTIPGQLCLPLLGCLNLAGQTLLAGWTYQVWILAVDLADSPTPPTFGLVARGQIGIGFAIAVLLLLFGALVGIVALRGILTGQLTAQDLQNIANQWLHTPGDNIQQAEWPLILLGAFSIIAGVGIPALALSGHLNLPGGFGLGGSAGTGGGAPLAALATTPTTRGGRRGS